MINRINTALAVLLLFVVGLAALVGVDVSQPNIEILPDMKYTPAWEAFAVNPNFPDGRTMQAPVPGTIARGQLPLHYTATKEDAIRAGEELENPRSLSAIQAAVNAEIEAAPTDEDASPDQNRTQGAAPAPGETQQNEAARRAALAGLRVADSVQRGGDVYRVFCISCHGAKGAGDGLVTQRGFPPPPSLLTGKSLQMKDGQLFHILTYGQGSMAPFAAQLSRDLRWDVINFVRDLQRQTPPPDGAATSQPEPPTALPAPSGKATTVEQPEKATPEKATPEKATPEKATPEKATPEKTAPEKTAESPPNTLRDTPERDAQSSASSPPP